MTSPADDPAPPVVMRPAQGGVWSATTETPSAGDIRPPAGDSFHAAYRDIRAAWFPESTTTTRGTA